ncbi:O-antigen ligase family protein [Methylorubrum aminovorans]|uniref:O-antigen ligase family protein n=1 Tax=Methylorubrum aminovorans TaxID=269069 RepID=UPI0032AF284B
MFDDRIRHRGAHLALALAGFVIAGSATSTASLIAVVPGLIAASRHRRLRLLGYTAFTVYLVLFVVLMVGLSAFPGLLEVVSVVLQKPPEELADATGRGTFWPVFIEATKDRFVGAGYAAGDRFIQLLIPTTALAETLARDAVFISSSHNMLLSAWAGTGLIGIGLCAMVLGAALRWGMKLDRAGRRLIATCVFFLILNGMTTPGIFQDWNINVLTFVALLAYARIGALHRGPAGAAAPAPEAAAFDLRRAAAA